MKRIFFALIAGLMATVYAGDTMKENPIVVFETNQGSIEIELMPKVAPKACENMLKLIERHYYDNVAFHRVIKDFMIQGGDPTMSGAGGESAFGKEFKDEISNAVKFTEPGLLAMANRGPNTNGSQFFITTKATPWLNGNHTIFGKVISGYDVVQKIENAPTTMQDRPVETQKIVKAFVKKET